MRFRSIFGLEILTWEQLVNIENELRELLFSELGLDEDPFACAKPLSDFGLDSLGFFDLVVAVERRYDIELDDSSLSSVRTVSDFAALVRNQWEARTPCEGRA